MTEPLEGAELDAAVAVAEGWQYFGAIGVNFDNPDKPYCLSGCNDWWRDNEGHLVCAGCCGYPKAYSADWSEGGPIIEREQITVQSWPDHWSALWYGQNGTAIGAVASGPTPLIAAMRAFVASKAASATVSQSVRSAGK